MGEDVKVRHILSLSGGKDSAAMAIFMRDRVPEMEYLFSDTLKELPETYEYLDKLENFLQRPIIRLNVDLGFDHFYDLYGGMIPSNHRRWCTRALKLKPFEDYVGDTPVINYVGLRADENRSGYVSGKPNITPAYPFREHGLILRDIEEILMSSGVGMPPYTKWGRTRSGCYFCFYQQKIEWVRLKEAHPDLYEKAKEYERPYEKTGNQFTWSSGESLVEMEQPERVAAIRKEHAKRVERNSQGRVMIPLMQIFGEAETGELPDEDDDQGCIVCTL